MGFSLLGNNLFGRDKFSGGLFEFGGGGCKGGGLSCCPGGGTGRPPPGSLVWNGRWGIREEPGSLFPKTSKGMASNGIPDNLGGPLLLTRVRFLVGNKESAWSSKS